MEQKTLAFSDREKLTKGAAKALRNEGMIPAVVYGQGKNANISILAREFDKKFSFKIKGEYLIQFHSAKLIISGIRIPSPVFLY